MGLWVSPPAFMGSPPEFIGFVAWVCGFAAGFVGLPLCSWVCCFMFMFLSSLGVHGFYFDLLLRVVSALISCLCLCFCCSLVVCRN